ncbi:MAG: hypothetical protein K2P63_15600 [Lachnospiraceae bacterium]|nr:hypothetical protein [Lachnospiraceae bacterium]
MISILLAVLKVIGITVLVILGIILFVLLLVLFVPVRYNGKGTYQDGLVTAKLRGTWLLHLISAKAVYESGQALHLCLRVLGITIYDNLREPRQKKRHKKGKSTKTKAKGTGEIQAASSQGDLSEEDWSGDVVSQEAGLDETAAQDVSLQDILPEFEEADFHAVPESGEEAETPDKFAENGEKKQGIFQKIKNFFINFVNFFKNIKFTFQKVCDTIGKIKDNIKYYLKVLQLDSTKRALAKCQKQLGRVLGRAVPRKYRVNLHLGFDDPAVMGEVLAVWGMFYPLHQGNIDIQPEFDRTVMSGDASFRGRICVFVFVRAACVLFFDKDIKRFIKHLKRS